MNPILIKKINLKIETKESKLGNEIFLRPKVFMQKIFSVS